MATEQNVQHQRREINALDPVFHVENNMFSCWKALGKKSKTNWSILSVLVLNRDIYVPLPEHKSLLFCYFNLLTQ